MKLCTICLNFIVLLSISAAQSRGPAENQLNDFKKTLKGKGSSYITTGTGVPIGKRDAILTVGERGPALLQDFIFLDQMAHFDRERIPERVVHAKGAGALGYFEVTKPHIQKYCAAKLFDRVGKKTPITARFSTEVGESGSADTVRDIRGFAVKFYTEEGIFDLLGLHTPMFFVRDPVLFPSAVHAFKRNPATNLRSYDSYWDFLTLRPEATFIILFLSTDNGTPDGFRYLNGFPINIFKLVNDHGNSYYCKFHFISDQGIRNLPLSVALNLTAYDPDYSIRDLYNAIGTGNYPSWTLNVQIMTQIEAENLSFNPFDVTKIWPEKRFPLIEVGRMVFNQNVENYFDEVEQASFNPGNLVPGIEPSEGDKMFHGRIFSYSDTQRYRVGTNHLKLPVNCPCRFSSAFENNIQRDGSMSTENQGGAPNYYPNSFDDQLLQESERARKLSPSFGVCGKAFRYSSKDEDNYSQATEYYNSLTSAEKTTLISNIASTLKYTSRPIAERAVKMFNKVSKDLGSRLAKAINL